MTPLLKRQQLSNERSMSRCGGKTTETQVAKETARCAGGWRLPHYACLASMLSFVNIPSCVSASFFLCCFRSSLPLSATLSASTHWLVERGERRISKHMQNKEAHNAKSYRCIADIPVEFRETQTPERQFESSRFYHYTSQRPNICCR